MSVVRVVVTESMRFSTGEVLEAGVELDTLDDLNWDQARRLDELAAKTFPDPSVWARWNGKLRILPLAGLRFVE